MSKEINIHGQCYSACDDLSVLSFPKKKFKFLGKEFEIETPISGEWLIAITGLMVCGKEYYNIMKELDVLIMPEELQEFIKNKFESEDLK